MKRSSLIALFLTGCVSASPLASFPDNKEGENKSSRYTVTLPSSPPSPNARLTNAEIKSHALQPQRAVHREISPLPAPLSDQDINNILSDNLEHEVVIITKEDPGLVVNDNAGKTPEQTSVTISRYKKIEDKLNYQLKSHKIKNVYNPFQRKGESTVASDQVQEHDSIKKPAKSNYIKIALSKYSQNQVREIISDLKKEDGVLYTGVSLNLKPLAPEYRQPPSDPGFPSASTWRDNDPYDTWWYNKHSIGTAWQYNKAEGVTVAVIDTSFSDHNDAINYIWSLRRNFKKTLWWVSDDDNVTPDSSQNPVDQIHGSTVAHVIGGARNDYGVCGISPNAQIIPISIKKESHRQPEVIAEAIKYAYNNGAKVINISFGSTTPGLTIEADPVIREELVNAWNRNVTVVLGAGNSAENLSSTQNFTGAIVVGGISYWNRFWNDNNGSSAFGNRVDMAAAAEAVKVGSYDPVTQSKNTRVLSGTSFAAPFVAGTAAMLKFYGLSNSQIRDMLIMTADLIPAYNPDAPSEVRSMCSEINTYDNLPVIRVLNAGSAVRLAGTYNPSKPVQIYASGPDDYIRIFSQSNSYTSVEGWYPSIEAPYGNYIANVPYPGTDSYINVYNEDGDWAYSQATFDNRSLVSWNQLGIPYTYNAKATGSQVSFSTNRITPTISTNYAPYPTGWVHLQYAGTY